MTDGVSLEIDKRRGILEKKGFTVATMAGPGSSGADFIIPSMDFNTPLARKIADNAFGEIRDYSDEANLMKDVNNLAALVEEEITPLIGEFNPDFILLHNIFSHGRHIASAAAFHSFLLKNRIRALATHHDFYWEREQYKQPSGPLIRDFLSHHVPPQLPGLKHAVINSLAADELFRRTGIEAMVFPDTLDFEAPVWEIDSWNSMLPEDSRFGEENIIVLQATRIVRRKGIELMVPILKLLNSDEILNKLKGKTIYNGKKITENSRFFYLIAGYAEEDAEEYRNSLEKLLETEEIPHRFISERVAAERSESNGRKTYSLFDVYPYADLVSYPSLYEGWGNQFLEAVFAQKPIMVFEYPVFQSDIKNKGYSVISMGNRAESGTENNLFHLPEGKVEEIAGKVVETLLNPRTPEVLKRNFQIGKAHNSYAVLEKLLNEGMAEL